MASKVEIVLSATGAQAVARVFDDLAKKGQQFASNLTTGSRQIEGALGMTTGTLRNVAGVMAQAGVNTGIFGQALGALGSPFGAAAAGAVALGLAIKTTTDHMVQNYDQMRALMAVSGLGAEKADQLADAFDLLGLNSQALTAALFKMSAEIDSGGKGLRELGVDIRDSTGALKAEGAIFLEIRDRISQMGSAAERNAAAMKFFGRSAREMAEVFALSTTEFNNWLAKAGMMGPSAEESVRVTREYTRAMAEFSKTLQGTVEVIGQKILPPMTELLRVTTSLANIASTPISITASFVVTGWEKFQEIRDKIGDWVNWAATGGRAKIGMSRLDDFRAEPEMDQLGSGVGLAKPAALMKAEVEQQKLALKEIEADRLRSIAVVQANMQAALKLNQADESEAAQQSIRLAQQTFAAKAAAIDGEIALIRRTSTEAIRDGTEAGDKIRALIGQRKDAHSQMSVAVIGYEASITKAAIDGQREIAAGSIETLKARLASSASLRAIQQQSALDIVGVQGGDEAAFRARLTAETQAKIDAAEAQTKTSADYAAAVEAIMAAHYAKLSGFLREAFDRDIAAMPEALGDLSRSIALVGDATEDDITPMEKAWEALRLEMVDVELASSALGGRFDTTSALMQIQEQRVRLLAAEFGPLSEKVRAAVGELDRLKDQQFGESLTQLGVEAQLFGDRFDLVGATISRLEGRLSEMARTSKGVVTPAMRELAVELEGLRHFDDLRDMFQDIFSSVGSAINTLVQGVIMGTQTMGEAFKKLGQSIVIEFVNRVIQQALNPLVKAAANAVATLLSGGSGGASFAPGTDPRIFTPDVNNEGTPTGFGTFSLPPGATSLANPSTLSSIWGTVTNIWGAISGSGGALGPAATGIGGVDVLLAGGSIADAAGAFGAAAQAASGLTVAAAGVAAAFAVFDNVMTLVNGNAEEFGLRLGLGVVGGVAGGIWGGPLGALAGVAIGDFLGGLLSDLFGFGGPSNYDLKRIAAADEANRALGSVAGGYQSALNSGNPAQVLAALQGGGGGAASNSVRTELVLPSSLATQIGITGQQIGDEVVAQWSAVTLDQFKQVLAAFQATPDLMQNLRGSGDVPYLEQADAEAIAEQIRQGAIAMLTAFNALEGVKDKIRTLAKDLGEAAKDVLPPDLATKFAEGIVNPIRDRMLNVLNAGLPAAEMQQQLESMAAELQTQTEAWAAFGEVFRQAVDLDALMPEGLGDKFRAAMQPEYDAILAALLAGNATLAKAVMTDFQKELAAWAAIGKALSTIDAEISAFTGSVDASVAAWKALSAQLTRTAERAGEAFERALASGDAERIAATAVAFHDATMARYQAELQMVQQIEAAMQKTLDGAAKLVQMVTQIGAIEIRGAGDFSTIAALIDGLATMAQTARTATARIWAVQQGLQAIIDTLPVAIEKFGHLATGPSQITSTVATSAAPFLAALQTAIDQVSGDAKLGLLQQQAAHFNALAQAAIAGVNQWAQQAIAAAQAASQAVLDNLAAQRDAQLAAIDEQIDSIQRAAEMEQESRRAQIDGLREAIAKAREWESALESMGKFIDSLKQGPLGPGNPRDKLTLAQDKFAAALKAYTAMPSAGGLTDLQGLAQTMLQLAEPIFSKPSPIFQTLSATTIKQLAAAQALAKQQATDSDVLQAQLDALEALDKTASKAARDQITALTAQRAQITRDFDRLIRSTEGDLRQQIRAIEDAAKAEIDAINTQLIGALKVNAVEQAKLVAEQLAQGDALIDALTSSGFGAGDMLAFIGQQQITVVAVLNQIRDALLAFPITPPESAAGGKERVTEGLYHLHDDEAVLPKALADKWRAAGGFDQEIRSAAQGTGMSQAMTDKLRAAGGLRGPRVDWDAILRDESRERKGGLWSGGFTWAGPRADELNAINAQIKRLDTEFSSTVHHNQSISQKGAFRYANTEDELAALNAMRVAQTAALMDRTKAILAEIKATAPTPPPVGQRPPPGGPPPPPPVKSPPPYVPPGPGWLSKAEKLAAPTTAGKGAGASLALTVNVEVNAASGTPKEIGKVVVEKVEESVRKGRLREMILDLTRTR